MKKLLTIVTESGEKARIDEGVNVSINVSGDSPCDVGEVLAKVTNLSSPRPVTPDMMPAPSAPPPMPMVKALDIVGKADEPSNPPMHPTMPPMAPETMGADPMMPDPSDEDIGTGGIMNPPAGQSGGSSAPSGIQMGGDQAELEALLSQAEEELGLSENDPEDDEDDNPFDTVDDIPDHRYNEEPEEEEESLLDPAMGSAHGEETEGTWGTAGGAALGAMAGGPLGAAAGAIAGDKLTGDSTEKEDVLEPKAKALTMNSSYKDIHDRLREIDRALQKKNEEFKNEPDPSMKDTNYMTKKIAGGLNKPKTMYPDSYKQGDNPMAMETVVREEWQKYKDGE